MSGTYNTSYGTVTNTVSSKNIPTKTVSKNPPPPPSTKKCFSTPSFAILVTAVIIFGIVAIIFIILYFRQNSGLIDPANCPPKVTGLIASPNVNISTPATNCGNIANCTYTVTSLANADQICIGLGTSKCAAFSLTHVPLTNNYTMVVSSSTSTTVASGTDTYVPL